MRTIKKIIVHCSDTPDERDIGLVEINVWHKERAFPAAKNGLFVGYHYVIRRNGVVEQARTDDEIGAHAKGHNSTSIGVCWVGRSSISKAQFNSLLNLIGHLCFQYGLNEKQVIGHNEVNLHKSCPNLDMNGFRFMLGKTLRGEI